MRDAVIALVVLGGLMLAGRWLVARRFSPNARVHVPSVDGVVTLRPPGREAALGLLALVGPAALGVYVLLVSRGAGALALAALTLASTAAGAAYLVARAVRAGVVVRETGLERVGVFRRRVAGWSAIAKIAFNPAQRWFFVTLADGSHLWLRVDAAGIGDFAAALLRRARPEVLEAADPLSREVLEDLARRVAAEVSARPPAW